MKYLYSFFLIVALISPVEIFAENGREQGNTCSLTLYPFQAFIGLYSLEGECALSEHFSLAVEFKYLNWDVSHDWIGGDWELSVLSLGPGLRYYPSDALDGFFIGPYVSYVSSTITYTDSDSGNRGKAALKGLNFALWLGYKLVIRNVFFELSTGVSYLNMNPEVTYINSSGTRTTKSLPLGLGGVYWPGVGLGIGYAF